MAPAKLLNAKLLTMQPRATARGCSYVYGSHRGEFTHLVGTAAAQSAGTAPDSTSARSILSARDPRTNSPSRNWRRRCADVPALIRVSCTWSQVQTPLSTEDRTSRMVMRRPLHNGGRIGDSLTVGERGRPEHSALLPRLRAITRDSAGATWTSSVTYVANARGQIDLDRCDATNRASVRRAGCPRDPPR